MIDYNKIIIILLILILLFMYHYAEQMKVMLLNFVVVLRGIIAPNCQWFHVSDIILNDGTGINYIIHLKENMEILLQVICSEKKYI